jgi:hypothetical protein
VKIRDGDGRKEEEGILWCLHRSGCVGSHPVHFLYTHTIGTLTKVATTVSDCRGTRHTTATLSYGAAVVAEQTKRSSSFRSSSFRSSSFQSTSRPAPTRYHLFGLRILSVLPPCRHRILQRKISTQYLPCAPQN